ncbi:hypothetical protein D8770_01155 [Methylobacterium sp. DB1607]|nr:hypothetical protein [Methylobacterium sp. DB1607]
MMAVRTEDRQEQDRTFGVDRRAEPRGSLVPDFGLLQTDQTLAKLESVRGTLVGILTTLPRQLQRQIATALMLLDLAHDLVEPSVHRHDRDRLPFASIINHKADPTSFLRSRRGRMRSRPQHF